MQSTEAVVHVQALMDKETANPEFAFMFNLQTPEHVYFRWRLFSLAQGGSLCKEMLRSICRTGILPPNHTTNQPEPALMQQVQQPLE